jgi:acyl-coenzyme A thioesterase PaaI-like protein
MSGTDSTSLQDELTPDGTCFGCGPANEDGLQLKSHRQNNDTVVATFTPDPKHQAAPGVLCGGIVGTLLDCHGVAAAAVALDAPHGEVLVTKEYTVRFRGITPISPLTLTAEAVEHDHRTATVHATLEHDGQVTDEFEGTFIAPNRPR